MLFQPISDLAVIAIQEVLADISQEMEVADKVRDSRKIRAHRGKDPLAHVMDQCNRVTIMAFDVVEKRDQQICPFRRQLDGICLYLITGQPQKPKRLNNIALLNSNCHFQS